MANWFKFKRRAGHTSAFDQLMQQHRQIHSFSPSQQYEYQRCQAIQARCNQDLN